MAYYSEEQVFEQYTLACDDADQWRIDYPDYERLADNGLLEDLDENLPEVNDGSLAAALFKMTKRVIRKKMAGRATALDRDDKWLTELANIYWEKKILPNAKTKASPRRKWKDAVRKAAIFGGQPIVTLFVRRGDYEGADFVVPYVYDVKLEYGKDSDEDSDIIFYDVYYSDLQMDNMIEQAEEENADYEAELKAAKEEGRDPVLPYNQWDVDELKKIREGQGKEQREGNEQPNQTQDGAGAKKEGYHFFIAFQRGVEAPFYMCHPGSKKCVREWANPDPTGDVPVHYLYYYQDFVNPYGIGIVKLAGGTQNVLDYMRQADILATQLGIRPPKKIKGDEDEVDEDSLVWAQDANWYVGNADVERVEIANGVYNQLPERISMYQTSLQKFLPMGDTTISGTDSGDPQYSKTPAGVKMQAASLSIDDEDLTENVDECYAAVARSMINIEFANMQGSDLLKLSSEEQEILQNAGVEFPVDAEGNPTLELEVWWDVARGQFDFEIDAEADKATDEAMQLEGLTTVVEFLKDPATQQFIATGQPILLGSKKLDPGELVGEIVNLSTDNDKILTDVTPEDITAKQQADAAAAAGGVDPVTGEPLAPPPAPGAAQLPGGEMPMPEEMPTEPAMAPAGLPGMPEAPMEDPLAMNPGVPAMSEEEQQIQAEIEEVMRLYNVDEGVALFMLEADRAGNETEVILDYLRQRGIIPPAPEQPAAPNPAEGVVL